MQLELKYPEPEGLTYADIEPLVAAQLLRPVRRTADWRVTEYEWTWLGRRMLGYSDPCERK